MAKFQDNQSVILNWKETQEKIQDICKLLEKGDLVYLKFDLNSSHLLYAIPCIISATLKCAFTFCDDIQANCVLSVTQSDIYFKRFHANPNCPNPILYWVQTSGTSGLKKVIGVPSSCIWPNIQDFMTVFHPKIIFSAAPPTFDPFYLDVFVSFLSKSPLILTSQNVSKITKFILKLLVICDKQIVILLTFLKRSRVKVDPNWLTFWRETMSIFVS